MGKGWGWLTFVASTLSWPVCYASLRSRTDGSDFAALPRPFYRHPPGPSAVSALADMQAGRGHSNTPVLRKHLGTANHAYYASSSIIIIHA
jgi:hypothetical protein